MGLPLLGPRRTGLRRAAQDKLINIVDDGPTEHPSHVTSADSGESAGPLILTGYLRVGTEDAAGVRGNVALPMTGAARFERLIGSSRVTPENIKARAVRGSAFSIAAESMDVLLRVGSMAILARMLVPEQFGLVGMVTAITAVAERFKDVGLSVATVQRKEITHEQVSTLFWVNAGLGILFAGLIAALAAPIARFFGDPRLFAITLAIASSFFWSGLTIQHQALLRRQMMFGRIAGIQLSASVLSIVLAVALAKMGAGYWALVAREVSRNVFQAVGSWTCLPWIPGRASRQTNIKGMLAFGGDVTAFNLIWFLVFNLDQIVVGRVFGAVPLGLYKQAVGLTQPVLTIGSAICSVTESALSRIQDLKAEYRSYYLRTLSVVSFVTVPIALFLAIFAEEVVLVVLGKHWTSATALVRILAIAAAVRPATGTAGFVMVTCGFSRRYLLWGVFNSLGLACLILIGMNAGLNGVAFAHVVASVLVLAPSLYWGFKGTPVRVADFMSAIQRPAVASLLTCAGLWVTKQAVSDQGALFVLLIGLTIGVPAYLGAWLVLPGGRDELTRTIGSLNSLFRGIWRK